MNKLTKIIYSLLFSLVLGTVQGQNSAGMVFIQMESAVATPGEPVCLRVSGSGMSDVLGMQFSIRWDPNLLEFIEIADLQLEGMSSNDFGTFFLDQGALTFAYIVPPSSTIPDDSHLFTLCLRAKADATGYSTVTLANSPTALEFVVDIDNVAQTIRNYTLLGGQVTFTDDSMPLSLNVKNELMTNCLIEGSTTIEVEAMGGTPPYSYDWTGPLGYANTGATLFLQRNGQFELIVTDAADRTLNARFAVYDSELRVNSITGTDTPCESVAAGSIELSVEGGRGERTYQWSNGASSEDLQGLDAGTYTVTISDAIGCAVVESVTIEAGSGISLDPETISPTCDESDGEIRLNAQSDAGGLFYNWEGDLDGDRVTGLAPGNYAVTVLDNKGCRAGATFDFSWDPLEASLDIACSADDSKQVVYTATSDARGGNGPYAFNWSTGATTTGATSSEAALPGAGTYTLIVTDAEGCTVQQSIEVSTCGSENPVWPGDTDDNGWVSHYDLLNIGLGYGQEGPAREIASLNWQSQAALAWDVATPASAVNFKYADTDGSGRIEAADTNAVVQHWGQIREDAGDEPADSPVGGASLFIEEKTMLVGEDAQFDILLGDASRQAQGAYGIAFRIRYDADAVVAESVEVSLIDSWLGGQGLLMLQRNNPVDHYVDVAITRTDQTDRSGFGAIGRLSLKTKDDLPSQSDRYEAAFQIENARLISAGEQLISLNPRESKLILREQTTTINDPALLKKIALFPNPARNQVQLQVTDLQVRFIELWRPSGQRLRSWNKPGILALDELPDGAYLLRIVTEEGVVSKPLLLIRE